MATVHPYKGYLNTEFHFYAKGTEDIPYSILSEDSGIDKPVLSGVLTPNIPHYIKLKDPGVYKVVFDDGTTSHIIVEDGYKFGGSRPKDAYIFDNTSWCMIVMYDRTYFYNKETEDGYVEAISPDSIVEVSRDFVIMKNKNHEEFTLYSLNEQKPILCFSDMICSTDETIVWKDKECLVVYSLAQRKIVHRIEASVYSFDENKNRLIFGKLNDVLFCELTGEYNISNVLTQKGTLITFVNNEISIYLSHNSSGSTIRICKLEDQSYVKEISVSGFVARINDVDLINIESRRRALYQFDLKNSDFPEALLEANFTEFIFYPCAWDIFYVQRDTKLSKTASRFNRDEEIRLKSVETNLCQCLNQFDNNTIINNSRFVIFNNSESFVRGRYYTAAGYISGDRILVHSHIVIRVSDGYVFTLSGNGYWDNRRECDYDFSLFEKYGIVKDNITGYYKSLYYNIKGTSYNTNPNPINHIELGGSIILEGGKVFYNESDLHKFSVKPLAVSPNLNQGIIIEDNKVYLLDISSNMENKKQILSGIFDASKYRDVILGEDGAQILYRDSEITRVTDIITGETFEFGNMSYIQQSNGMRAHFQRSGALQPRIVNPITGQIIDADLMKQYTFISPDGLFYADTCLDEYIEHYYIETDEIISAEEYRILYDSLKFPSKDKKDTDEWEQVKQRRIEFVKKHFVFLNSHYPQLLHNDPTGKIWAQFVVGDEIGLDASIFIGRVIAVRGIAIIRNTSSGDEVARIKLGLPLSFLNYVSFSMNSRYVALAGYRNFSNGLFLIYDLIEHKTLCREDTSRAVWLTAFSARGHLAAYTSDPNTIYFDDMYECDTEECLKNHLISDRNFLTYSPDGAYIALSNQGYVPYNDSVNWGHQPSTYVEIRNAGVEAIPLLVFNDLSNNGIANVASRSNTVASVSFSNDNKRLMMVGNDGVVVIRNLHLDDNAVE